MKSLAWKKITIYNREYYVIMHGKTKVSISYLPKILKTLTSNILHILGSKYHGKVLIYKHKNLIVFETEENAKDAAEWLDSIRIIDKL